MAFDEDAPGGQVSPDIVENMDVAAPRDKDTMNHYGGGPLPRGDMPGGCSRYKGAPPLITSLLEDDFTLRTSRARLEMEEHLRLGALEEA